MHYFFDNFSEFINSISPFWSYVTIFFISLIDTLMIIGSFFPASLFIIAAGFLAATGVLNIWIAILVVLVGGVVGDLVSYYFGTKGTSWFKNEKKILKMAYLDKGEKFFLKYGDKGIIFGRFLGIIKSIIPFVAGLFKIDFKKFLYLNIIAGLAWTIVHLGIGFLLGKTMGVFLMSKNLKVLLFCLPFILVCIWIIYEARHKILAIFLKDKEKNIESLSKIEDSEKN